VAAVLWTGPGEKKATIVPAGTPGNVALRAIYARRDRAHADADAVLREAQRAAAESNRRAMRQAGLGADPINDERVREALPDGAGDALLRLMPDPIRGTLAGMASHLPTQPSNRFKINGAVWDQEREAIADAMAIVRRLK
jgi:hypothetical protein